MTAHCQKERRITLMYVKDGLASFTTFDSWEAVAIFINDHGFEGRNIHITAWEYEDDKQ